MPDWPCRFQVRLVGMMVLLAVPIAVTTLPKDAGMGCPASLSSIGLGSNRSRWLGPPSMNRKMTDFALAGKCGFLGLSGSAAADRSPASMDVSAIAPKPDPAWARKSRREVGRRL